MVANRTGAEREAERVLATLSKEVDDMREAAWFSDRATRALVLGEYAKFYFGRKGDETWPLRMTLQCEGDESSFVTGLAFEVDGTSYPIATQPGDWSRDRGSGKLWVMLDMPISRRHPELAQALSGAQAATVRFRSDDHSWEWTVPRPQLDALGRVYSAWSALIAAEKIAGR